jgi:hypothetical protein
MHFFILYIEEREEESTSWWCHEEGKGLEKISVIIISATQVKDLITCISWTPYLSYVSVTACQRVSRPQTMTYTSFLFSQDLNKFPLKNLIENDKLNYSINQLLRDGHMTLRSHDVECGVPILRLNINVTVSFRRSHAAVT